MEVDDKPKNEVGHSANSIFDKPDDALFEEFEEIEEAIMHADQDDEVEVVPHVVLVPRVLLEGHVLVVKSLALQT